VIARSDTESKEKEPHTSKRLLVKIRKEKKMTTAQTMLQRDRTEEEFVAELETESTQELAQFLAGAWTASLFSPEAIEELYQALQGKQASEPERVEEDAVEMAQD
jgi:hypothetical protein